MGERGPHHEAVVLLRVQHLEQRGSRVPSPVTVPHFVHLVQKENSIADTRPLQPLSTPHTPAPQSISLKYDIGFTT
jgi:hypothetical protein